MQRTLQPELLDSLPPDHPDALHNRRDLRLTNQILGGPRWIRRTLAAHVRPGERILELGAGTGELGVALIRQGLPVDGLDLWPRPSAWPAAARWHAADLLAFAGYAAYPAICGNLILHQFSDEQLGELGAQWRRSARIVVAAEPARRRISQWLYRAFAPAFGANHVSLHDAHVSIAAGFRGSELPRALGLGAPEWQVCCTTTILGLHCMIALRGS
jgi:hypothetical protein